MAISMEDQNENQIAVRGCGIERRDLGGFQHDVEFSVSNAYR